MLLPRAGARLLPFGCLRSTLIEPRRSNRAIRDVARSVSTGPEFSLSPYHDIPELGFGRGREFCMLTLRHPSFFDASGACAKKLYDQKRIDRTAHLLDIFHSCDAEKTNHLNEKQLGEALTMIGMPPNTAMIAGMLQRHNKRRDGLVQPEEYLAIVHEVWGRITDGILNDELHIAYKDVQDQAPLDGVRAVGFIGRASPIGWVLRSLRAMWPYALKSCKVLRNTTDNPQLDRDLMEVITDTYEGDRVQGMSTIEEFAEFAALHDPTKKGGLIIRLEPTKLARDRWSDETNGVAVLVPLRGLPENPGPGFFQNIGIKFRDFRGV